MSLLIVIVCPAMPINTGNTLILSLLFRKKNLRGKILTMLKEVRVNIKGGYRDKHNLNRVICIIIIHFFVKSVRIEPCVVERKNRFIFEKEITFDLSTLNTAKIKVCFKKVLNKFNPILKLYIILLTKNNIYLFDSQMKIYNIQCVQLPCAWLNQLFTNWYVGAWRLG